MIINAAAAYEGPPFKPSCSSCQVSTNNTSPLAGLSYTNVGSLIMAGLAVLVVGITLYGINGKSKKSLAGRRSRR